MATYSVIIPTLGRSESLRDCLESLWSQTNQDFEIITVTEKGPLATLRNHGARISGGKRLIFIDDDVICSPGWIEAIDKGFRKGYAGVSGPAVISKEYRKQRDIFKYEWISRLFASSKEVGKITKAGTWTRGASRADCKYEGEVDYLEACNMAFDAEAFWEVGGFDERYGGVGDWSEPDLCFRLRQEGHKLFFANGARLEHQPSQTGAYKKRLTKSNRLENYELFSKRWIKPYWQHSLHKFVLRNYINFKEKGWL